MVQQPPGMPPPSPQGPQQPMGQSGGFDTSQLSIPDVVVAASSFLGLIFAFTGWYKVEIFFMKETGSGGPQWIVRLLLFALLAFAVVNIINSYNSFLPENIPSGLIYIGLAGACILFTLLGLVWKPGGGATGIGMNFPMWILALICQGGCAAGAVLKVNESE